MVVGVLSISYKDHVTNEEVHAKIEQAIGPHEDPPNQRKETQTAVILTCLLFISSGQNHLARHSERGEKTKQTEEEVGRRGRGWKTTSGYRQAWSSPSSGEQGKVEETGCELICGDRTTLAVKG